MKNYVIYFTALVLFCFAGVHGQTASDIKAKYKKYNNSEYAYSVSEKIWMSPEFAADGQVCRLTFYPVRDRFETLPFEEFMNVLDSTLPAGKRGAKKDSFVGGATGVGKAWTTFRYEKIFLTFVTSFDTDEVIASSTPFNFSEAYSPSEKQQNAPVAKDDFLTYREYEFETAAITWNDRKCPYN